MTYNIDKLRNAYTNMTENKTKKKYTPPFASWKPVLGDDGKSKTYNIRILPYQDQTGQPFQEVMFYDNKNLTPYRLVAPNQFGLPDPIASLFKQLKEDKKKKTPWPVLKGLSPSARYFIPVVVREEMSKGVQIWEISPTLCKEFYRQLVSEDFANEDVTSPDTGYDFTVTVSPSGKMFKAPNGKEFPVNDVSVTARKKSTKLSSSKEESEKIIASIPDLKKIFTSQVKSEEHLNDCIESYLQADMGSSDTPSKSALTSLDEDSAKKDIEDVFSDIDI